MIDLAAIQHAQTRIAPYVRRTPTVASETLSARLGARVYLKLELFQKTGSFKPRGAFNQMLSLDDAARKRGVVAVSGGNFAQAVAYAGKTLGVATRILMPAFTPKNYLDATQAYGAQIELHPDLQAAFDAAAPHRERGFVFLHPYDDPLAMAGYGTIGLELLDEIPALTDVIVSVGGGGLLSGIASAIKARKPDTRVWSVETAGADTLGRALKAGQVVPMKPTSLAKTLGAPVVSATALRIAQTHIAEHLIVSDRDAYRAQRFILERAKVLTELAASCTLAAAEQIQNHFMRDSHVALVLCGGNVSLDDVAAYKKQFE